MTIATETVEAAEKIVAQLGDRLEHLTGRASILAKQRAQLSFAAETGDKSAKTKLAALNAETTTHGLDFENVQNALQEARHRLDAARRDAAIATDREQALALRAKLAKFVETGADVDDALWDFVASLRAMLTILGELHQLGQPHPSSDMFRVNAVNAIKAALQELPRSWVGDLEFQLLAPNQKKKFSDLTAAWNAQAERSIAARLGEEKEVA